MQHRRLGRTDMTASAISFGAWAIGGAWGDVDDKESLRALHAAIDTGVTFSGVPYEIGRDAVEAMRPLLLAGTSLAQFALRRILMFDAVSCAIPGAKTEAQARDNAAASELPPLSDATMAAVRAFYDQPIRPLVHASW